ncbi:PREDICTED: alpha-mannosidase 2C1-like [Priapulus caudatus]|uniref:alpha-mannosidase n=1 Tax=Priapulus caudatus TaxID=37621 RepID=A0ABM1ENE9_PRICU|nr:PREDICTED: alpha-mannosidase 2C1-like [Priapulus caudatus]
MEVPQIKNTRSAIERVEKFISDEFFTDVNIKGKRRYLEKRDITGISHLAAPGRITYDEALASTDWAPAVIGDSFGPTNQAPSYGIFKANIGLNGKPGNIRTDYILTQNLTTGLPSRVIYIEMACNNLFGAGDGNDIAPPDPNRYYTLDMAEISVFNRPAYDLVMDFDVLHDIMKVFSWSTHWFKLTISYPAEWVGNEIRLRWNTSSEGMVWEEGVPMQVSMFPIRELRTMKLLTWLWPYDETKRKCARSFSTALQLMQLYPDMTFACSQAQQLKWVKENYPELFVKLQEASSMGGRFLTVGGTWIEMDGNVPSGESFIRQFAMGQKFFEKEFGKKCTVFWLPDTFGYSAQLPQIVRLAGIKNFLSQKMSWNLVNTFPNNSFYWEGIDGSRVLTHFPPADTYVAEAYPREVVKCSENNKDKGRADCSILLYGFGDGGGGPTQIKMLNRACEMLLQQWEFLQAMLSVQPRISRTQATRAVPASSEAYWEILLLNQFHDVLPGTSIEMVCVEAVEMLTKLRDELARDVEVMRLQLLMAAPAPAPRMQPVVKVCGHKWADMSETGVGVALLNDCKYGYSCYKNVLRLSLLRAPKSPNANSDIGKHEFTYAIMPHKGTFQSAGVVQQAYNLNSPLGVARVSVPVTAKSWLSVDNPAVVLETVKKDEMNPEAIIVRMYEAYGSTAHATINVGLPVQKVFECDIFEKDDSSAPYEVKNSTFQVKLTPFQVKTVKCWIMR